MTDDNRLLSANIYLTNLDRDYDAMNKVWDEWIPEGEK